MTARKDINERFDSKWSLDPKTGCHMWKSQRHTTGYGTFEISVGKGKPIRVRAHRFAWERANGEIPAGMCICHRCDTPLCVNPEHLFLGTHADNAADRDRKGRTVTARGERAGSAKLTEAQVAFIKGLFLWSAPVVVIARAFNVDTKTIALIKAGATWKGVKASPYLISPV